MRLFTLLMFFTSLNVSADPKNRIEASSWLKMNFESNQTYLNKLVQFANSDKDFSDLMFDGNNSFLPNSTNLKPLEKQAQQNMTDLMRLGGISWIRKYNNGLILEVGRFDEESDSYAAGYFYSNGKSVNFEKCDFELNAKPLETCIAQLSGDWYEAITKVNIETAP